LDPDRYPLQTGGESHRLNSTGVAMKPIWIIVLVSIMISLHAQEFSCEKVSEFSIAQSYCQIDNLIESEGFLYALSSYGLEIFEIQPGGSLVMLSRTEIGHPSRIALKDEYLYVATAPSEMFALQSHLIQFNITDKTNPTIENELDFGYNSIFIQVYNSYLDVKSNNNEVNIHTFYSLPQLVSVAQYDNLGILEKISETMALSANSNLQNNFTLVDLSDVTAPEEIGAGNVNSQHQYSITRVQTYQDSILIFSEIYNMSFWNISDPYNWQHRATYHFPSALYFFHKPLIVDDLLLLPQSDFIEVMDISDLDAIQVLSQTPLPEYDGHSCFGARQDENIYYATSQNGIKHYVLQDNMLTFLNQYKEHTYSRQSVRVDDYLIQSTTKDGFYIYDITNPLQPIQLDGISGRHYSEFDISGRKLAAFNEEYTYFIYDLEDMHAPSIRNQIDLDQFYFCKFDASDETALYLVDKAYGTFRKYNVTNPGDNDLLFDISLPFYPHDWVVQDGYAYITEYVSSSNKRLYVYEGLSENSPSLCTTLDHFSEANFLRMKMLDSRLCIYSNSAMEVLPQYRTRLYDLSTPQEPSLAFELDAIGEPFSNDEIIMSKTWFGCFVFENDPNPSGVYEPIAMPLTSSSVNGIVFLEDGNQSYFYSCQPSGNAIYEYTYTPASADPQLAPLPAVTLSNYPNPFKPAAAGRGAATEILFSLSSELYEPDEQLIIDIFNVKGQKVRKLEMRNEELEMKSDLSYSVTWDGTDSSNQPVASGVYLYQLRAGKQTLAQKKMMLLK
jgi:hypothetical protein